MQCREINTLFSAYIDGMLDPSLQNAVDQHIKNCASCRSELDGLKYTVGLLRRLPLVEPPAEFRQELFMKLDRIRTQEKKSGWACIRRMLTGSRAGIIAAAAVFMLVIGASYAWLALPQMSEMQLGRVQSESHDLKGYNEEYSKKEDKVDSLEAASGTSGGAPTQVALSGERAADAAVAPEMWDTPVASQRMDERAVTQVENDGAVQKSAFVPAHSNGVPDSGRETAARSPAPAAAETPQVDPGAAETCSGVEDTTFRLFSVPDPAEPAGDGAEKVVLKLKVSDVKDAAGRIFALAGENGWPVSETPETGGRELIMCIPAAQLDQATAELGKIGVIVTGEYPARSGTGKRLELPVDSLDAGAEETAEASGAEEEEEEKEIITLQIRLE